MATRSDHSTMRGANRELILSVVRRGLVSRSDLSRATALAKPTVSTIVEELVHEGLILEVGQGSTTRVGGRPPTMLQFNAHSTFLAGVHLGVTRTTVVSADALGAELSRATIPTPTGRPAAVLRAIGRAIERTMGEHLPLSSVGVALPGMVDTARGVCRLAPNLGWRDVPVADLLGAQLGVPVFAHNTAQAVAVAERLEGAAQGFDDVAVLYLGSGVGAGLLSAGRLEHGAQGLAGEIGHCQLFGTTAQCRCGKAGCLEATASGWALVRDAEQARSGRTRTALSRIQGPLEVEHLVAAASQGDRYASELLGRHGAVLGTAASWLVTMSNPGVLILAGRLVQAGELLLGPLLQHARSQSLALAWDSVQVRHAQLGPDVEVRGAVLLALQNMEESYRALFLD